MLLLVLLAPLAIAAAPKAVPVIVASEPELDACPSLAEVTGLRREGFLAVRTGPGTGYEQVDTFHAGRRFFLCATSPDGKWFGIVYPPDGDLEFNCEVGANGTAPRAYTGPCRYGWVHSNWVKVIAG
jgi:hypothetical protein